MIPLPDSGYLDEAIYREAQQREAQQMENAGWLAAAEGAFTFWNNDDDAAWERVPVT